MKSVFIKVKDDSYELVNKETGELTDLYETFRIDEDTWFKLYIKTFCAALGEITSLKELKLFSNCLRFSTDREEYGNIINITDVKFRKMVDENLNLSRQNLNRALKSLCEKGFLHKIDSLNYRINPQIAYCGSRHNRANLILKLIKE